MHPQCGPRIECQRECEVIRLAEERPETMAAAAAPNTVRLKAVVPDARSIAQEVRVWPSVCAMLVDIRG